MAITHWNPFREMAEINERLNRAFGNQLLTPEHGNKDALVGFDWVPPVDILETTEEFQVKAQLPDVKREDIKIDVQDGVLSITGERKQEKEEQNKKWHRVEQSYGSFLRTFSLPNNVDQSQIQAEYKDGILTLRLPKAVAAQPRSIDIKVNN